MENDYVSAVALASFSDPIVGSVHRNRRVMVPVNHAAHLTKLKLIRLETPITPPVASSLPANRGIWEGKTAFLVASGPSLTEADVQKLREVKGQHPIAVTNDTYRMVPFADVLYACDKRWWTTHHDAVLSSRFAGALWTQNAGIAHRNKINYIPSLDRPGLGTGDAIHQGGNSGYQLINLAYLLGAKKIVLLGYDCSASPEGQHHWFGQHTAPGLSKTQPYNLWAPKFEVLARGLQAQGVEVLNASRRTALTCFPKVTLKKAIKEAPNGSDNPSPAEA